MLNLTPESALSLTMILITVAALFALAHYADTRQRKREAAQIEADERAADALIAVYSLESRRAAPHHSEGGLEMVPNRRYLTDDDLAELARVPSSQLPAAIRARIGKRGGIPSPLRRDPMKRYTQGACLIPPADMAKAEARQAQQPIGDAKPEPQQ